MHIHTDAVAFLFAGVSALLLFHLMRIGGAWLAQHNAPSAGKLIGGLATFN